MIAVIRLVGLIIWIYIRVIIVLFSKSVPIAVGGCYGGGGLNASTHDDVKLWERFPQYWPSVIESTDEFRTHRSIDAQL